MTDFDFYCSIWRNDLITLLRIMIVVKYQGVWRVVNLKLRYPEYRRSCRQGSCSHLN